MSNSANAQGEALPVQLAGPEASARQAPKRVMGRSWTFTINNPTDDDNPAKWDDVQYMIYQKEVSKTGTPHLQGYVHFPKNKTNVATKKLNNKAHWELARGSVDQNAHYCSKPVKDCTCIHCKDLDPAMRLAGPFESGTRPQPGKRTDIEEFKDDVKAGKPLIDLVDTHMPLFLKYPSAVKQIRQIFLPDRKEQTELAIWYGAPGTGKTTEAKAKWPDAFWLSQLGPKGTVWWDGYDGQETVIIDEFQGFIDIPTMCSLINHSPYTVNVKGTTAKFTTKLVVIISNLHPNKWWPGYPDTYYGMHRRIKEAVECRHFMQVIPRLTLARVDPFPGMVSGTKRSYSEIEPAKADSAPRVEPQADDNDEDIDDIVTNERGAHVQTYTASSAKQPSAPRPAPCIEEDCNNSAWEGSKYFCVYHDPKHTDSASEGEGQSFAKQCNDFEKDHPELATYYGAQR